TLDLATNWLLLPASSTDEQTIPSKNHLNSTLNRKCGGTSADGQPPLKRSDGLGTRSNFSDLYLNRSSPSGSDLDVSSSIRDPLTSLSLSLPGSDQAPMIPQELPEMGLEKKMLNPEFLGGDACRR
ncbi:hypothetical protein LINPERPRIM_LOCUS640, partial [Linum perenne]